MSTATTSRTVFLDRYGQFLAIRPAVPELDALATTYHQPYTTRKGFGIRRIKGTMLMRHDSRDQMHCLAGLEPVRKIGIGQGNPYSPTALNVRMHHSHDTLLTGAFPDTVWLRYADNTFYLTKDIKASNHVGDVARACLKKTGLKFNVKDHCQVDLRQQESTRILGFHLRLIGERLVYRAAEHTFRELEEALLLAHDSSDPPKEAYDIVAGWIVVWAPAHAKPAWAETHATGLGRTGAARFRWRRPYSIGRAGYENFLNMGSGPFWAYLNNQSLLASG